MAKVGSKVKWHGEGELIELKPTEIRGVASEGMICAANEIGLFDAFPHAEREIVTFNELFEGEKTPKAGTPLADVLGLSGDVVMDIEVTTNRPDAAGVVGLAREAAAILKRPLSGNRRRRFRRRKVSWISRSPTRNCVRGTWA